MKTKMVTAFVAFLLVFSALAIPASATPGNFLIGQGIYDITGPAAEVRMMGYSMVDQITAGIHSRLWSRAFVIVDPGSGKRVVFVCADLGIMTQALKQQVMEKVQADPALGGLYTNGNVMLTASHTHSGPGGYSHYTTYDLSILGFIEQNFNVIRDGIYQSIAIAHTNLKPATIQIAQGDMADCGRQRSYDAYMNNPATERALYAHNTDKTMTLLKFVGDSGEEIGLVSFYALHPTSIGNTNTLISSDNKGYAEYLFERLKGADHYASNQDTFIAAFAQTNAGDVSPNVEFGYPVGGAEDYAHMYDMGTRMFDTASALYNGAAEFVEAGIDYRHKHVNFDELPVAPEWVGGQTGIQTCSAAIGMSQIAGSTEDGAGIDLAHEGMVWGSNDWPEFTLVPELQECQEEKIILLPAGDMSPFPWVPEVLPLQVFTIGNVAIAAVPFEVSTMAGRRIRETVLNRLGDGVDYVILAALANAYCSYITTTEEYALQHYEGGSNMFGPYSLNACQQELASLADALAAGTPVAPGPSPRDLRNDVVNFQTGVVFDGKYLSQEFGDCEIDANPIYNAGDVVTVQFVGGHPKNNLLTMDSYIKIEKMKDEVVEVCHEEQVGCDTIIVCEDVVTPVYDRVVATDNDPTTIYRWEREGVDRSNVIIHWTITGDIEPGQYRVHHSGHWKNGWDGSINPYEGYSSVFVVQ